MKKLTTRISVTAFTAAMAALLLVFANGTPALAAASPAVTSQTAIAPAPAILTWSAYDGSQITTAAKCQARLAYLKAANPSYLRWMCEEFPGALCPPKPYWLVMVADSLGTIAPASRPTASAASAPLATSCG
jgi:hypothetical protein